VPATLLTGVIWGAWHLPLLLAGLTYPGAPLQAAVPIYVLSTVALSFLFTWLHHRSQGSVLAAALLHGVLNVLTEITAPQQLPGSNPLIVNVFGLLPALLIWLAVAAYFGLGRRKGGNSGH